MTDSDPQEFSEAYNRTLGLLSRRDHSAMELRRKLSSRGYDDDLVEQVLEQLESRGLQSDELFARNYVQSRRGRGFGPVKIAAELRQHGIDRQLLSDLVDERDRGWLLECQRLMERKFSRATGAVDRKEKLRRSRFLLQRGFPPSMVSRLLDGSSHDDFEFDE